MTEAEKAFWSKVRRKQLMGAPFYRQKPIGNFIVDFYCPAGRLIVEIDGGQHYQPKGAVRDAVRDAFLKSLGLAVLRFSNLDVLNNIDGVLDTIVRHLTTVLDLEKTKSP